MADDVTPSEADTDFGASNGGGASSWVSAHKGQVAGGAVVLVVALYLYIKNKGSSSSSSGSLGTSTGPAVYEVAPGYLTSGQQYGSSIGADQGIASGVQTGPTGGGSPATGGATTTGPSYQAVPNQNASASIIKSGGTIYLNVPGQPGTYVPGIVNGQKTSEWYVLAGQPGVGQYIQQPSVA